MAATPASEYERILRQQLAMNRHTWTTLQEHGVTEATELRLDFAFRAPNREAAERLAALLKEQTDYDASAEADGSVFRKRWSVLGQTQPTRVSAAVLDQWVDWMVTAEITCGCEFDGWGAEV